MIAAIYTKEGIVISTLALDTFYEMLEVNNAQTLHPIVCKGISHTVTLWDRYTFVFRSMNPYVFDNSLSNWLQEYQFRMRNVPGIEETRKNILDYITKEHLDIFGVFAGYENSIPYVYSIQGETYRRLNITEKNDIIYSCSFFERDEVVGKLFRDVKIKNGDEWETRTGMRPRCDLFSIKKAVDLSHFLLSVNYHINNVNSSLYEDPLEYETIIVKSNSIQTL